MFITSIKIKKRNFFIVLLMLALVCMLFLSFRFTSYANLYSKNSEGDEFIKWVDFNVCYDALMQTSKLDINSHVNNEDIKYNWIELLAYLGTKYGGNFDKYNKKDLDTLVSNLKSGTTIYDLTKDMKYYPYYYECYDAVLHEFIGTYKKETSKTDSTITYEEKYGIKAFLPIAKNYSFNHYDDFGNSRSYGFKRVHLGNDLMGSIGTPVIAVESGTIEALGWNQYGGWRIGIRSEDGKRYYYYAHLRKDHPYAENMYEGKKVTAGDVIGYLGMTGYSQKENINNINVPHLHFGMQLIFDESQVDGKNEIWINVYEIINFLKQNKSEVYRSNQETKDYSRKYSIIDSAF